MMFGNINSSGATIDGRQHGEANDILLPNQTGRVQKVAVVYFTASDSSDQGGRMHFQAFETDNVEKCVAFIRNLLDSSQPPSSVPATQEPGVDSPVIRATGGGAHRFRDLLDRELGVQIEVVEEMESLIKGLNFLIREVADEVFTYSEDAPMQFENLASDDFFPYMLVNIGSGVSILKVTSENEYERISGTSLGGGTLWGLLNLLTGVRSFDEMLEMTKTGDNTKVDMMVGDIYGTNYDKIGLKATNIASTMAGVYRKSLDKQFDDADIARSLLYMVSNNIGQIAYLNARLHNVKRIYFGGYFIRGHPLTMHTLSYAINFWSKGEMRALFLRHEGFLGATGAFTIADDAVSALGVLDRQPSQLLPLPQLVNSTRTPYSPDTVDLSTDTKQRSYWISAMEKNTNGLLELADNGALECGPDTQSKMTGFVALYLKHLRRLREQPQAYGLISVRMLLGLREQCLHEVGLEDIFAHVKERETDAALLALPEVIQETDRISDQSQRLTTVLQNVLAGNMFDWGSTSLRDKLASGNLDFAHARTTFARRPQFDNTEAIRRAYRKAVIFVDNSGADVCLGILPLARSLLASGTDVVELVDIVCRAAHIDSILDMGWREGRLQVCGTGSSGPSAWCAIAQAADLVVIVGMGRAIHSNYRANQMAADAAGAQIYDGLCWYEPGQ
ncbi:fumble-domain-containing protein, partial [Linderina pennispora]